MKQGLSAPAQPIVKGAMTRVEAQDVTHIDVATPIRSEGGELARVCLFENKRLLDDDVQPAFDRLFCDDVVRRLGHDDVEHVEGMRVEHLRQACIRGQVDPVRSARGGRVSMKGILRFRPSDRCERAGVLVADTHELGLRHARPRFEVNAAKPARTHLTNPDSSHSTAPSRHA
ncbi:MAG: hypothetical protein R3B70_38890 [Polyangiaceae bacterium]